MRSLALIVLAPLVAQARVCGPAEPAQPIPPVNAAVAVSANAAVPLTAKHGGTVVSVGDVDMELLVKGDGQVVAYPVQPTATVSPSLTSDSHVVVDVPVQSGGTRPVNLVWSPTDLRFVGQVQGAAVVTAPQATMNVTVVRNGRRHHGRFNNVVVAPAGFIATPGVIVATPGIVATAPAVVATTPGVVVARPGVVVQTPGVVVTRPAVVVEAPPPPVIRLQPPVVGVQIGGGVRVDGDYRVEEGGHYDNGLHRGEFRGGGGGEFHGGGGGEFRGGGGERGEFHGGGGGHGRH